MKVAIFCLLSLFFGVRTVFAGDAPILLSPSNNSTVTSSKLEWQVPSYPLHTGGSYYMVQVDDQQDFINPEKNNIYLTNNYYTPKLNPGTWYWRVKAKDASGNWSNWSNTWSFILGNSTPTAAPSPTPSPTLSPSTNSTHSSSFIISNIPSQINSDQSFNATVNLSLPDYPNTNFYLKGAFKKSDGSNYFGLTKVGSGWVKNGSSYSDQYSITTDSSGNWSGNLEIQPDSNDSGFSGTGDYIFKVGRYTNSGSGPSWSNETSIKIIVVAIDSQETSVDTSDTPTKVSNQSTIANASSIPKSIKSTPSLTTVKKMDYQITSVAGTTASAIPEKISVKSEKQINVLPLIGGGLIIIGITLLIYVYLRNRKIV